VRRVVAWADAKEHEVEREQQRARRGAGARVRRGLVPGLALSLVAVITVIVPTATARADGAAPPRSATVPVLVVHGYLFNTCPGTNPNTTFADLTKQLSATKYGGKVDPIDYYACDSKGSDIQHSGDANAYFPGGAYGSSLGGAVKGGNTDNTDLRHIAYQLAWYIYGTYSSKGRAVSVVAHSMGGLIVRWMLYRIQAHDSAFPPSLYVQDVVTISTPHDGTDDGSKNAVWCPSSTQCKQMLPGSPFLTELHQYGMAPQGTSGTDWTALGDAPCDPISKTPAGTTLDVGAAHKVSYYAAKGKAPVCYSHTSYLTDTGDKVDMPVRTTEPGGAPVTGLGPHSLRRVVAALTSAGA
jgi:triacylglycerol esterase/lipase EstA (alpha/beta hydrolase family)